MNEPRPATRTLSVTTRGVVGSILVFVVAAICVRLGFWQLDRLAHRRERNEGLRQRMDAPAVSLRTIPHDTSGLLDRRVAIRGRYDAARSIVLPGRAFRGTPGAHVLTPVLLEDGGAILVDRGWVPAADGATVDLDQLVPDSVLDGEALLLRFPGQDGWNAAGPASPPAGSEFRRVWFAVDEAALRRQFPYPLAPLQAQLLPHGTNGGYPLPSEAPVLDQGPHLGYAIQWFSFAIIAIVGWMAMILKSGVDRSGNAADGSGIRQR